MGGLVQTIAYNSLHTGWVGLNKFLRKIFVHEKNEKSEKFATNTSKLSQKMSLLFIMTIFIAFFIPILCQNQAK